MRIQLVNDPAAGRDREGWRRRVERAESSVVISRLTTTTVEMVAQLNLRRSSRRSAGALSTVELPTPIVCVTKDNPKLETTEPTSDVTTRAKQDTFVVRRRRHRVDPLADTAEIRIDTGRLVRGNNR